MAVTPSTTTHDFGPSPQGIAAATTTITLTNTGAAVTIASSAPQFSLDTTTVAAGSTQAPVTTDVTVTFTPDAAGLFQGTIRHDVNGVPTTLTTLDGQGTTTRDLGQWLVGASSAPVTVGLVNGTTSPVTLSSGDGQFALDVTNLPGATVVGSTVTPSTTFVKITFTPGSTGSKNASISAASHALVSGTGVGLNATDVDTEADQELEYIDTDQSEGGSSAAVPSGDNKYWEVELDYNFDATRKINSYLRIGTFETNSALQTDTNNNPVPASSASTTQNAAFHRGHDLAAMIVDFYDDTRDRGVPGDPFFTDPAERVAESALLHTKGGWRDHSDGNRISTTRGDKIEVIRGNYQMVVLGRQDQLANQSRYEAGGGHFSRDSDNLTPGAIFKISWRQDKFNGTWKVIEETTKGDYLVRYHGDVREEYFGNSITTIVGSENSGGQISGWESGQDPNVLEANPIIVETTFAESMTIQEGSAARPIPTINDTSFARDITEVDHSTGTIIDKDYSEGSVIEGIYAKGTLTEERRGDYVGQFDGNSKEFWGMKVAAPDDPYKPSNFSHRAETTNFMEIFGGATESFKLGFFLEFLTPLMFEVFVGKRVSAELGGAHELFAGFKTEINFGHKAEVNFWKTEMDFKEDWAGLSKSEKAIAILIG